MKVKPDWMPWDMVLVIVFLVLYTPFAIWAALQP